MNASETRLVTSEPLPEGMFSLKAGRERSEGGRRRAPQPALKARLLVPDRRCFGYCINGCRATVHCRLVLPGALVFAQPTPSCCDFPRTRFAYDGILTETRADRHWIAVGTGGLALSMPEARGEMRET